jgi:hypothetical protein
MTCGPNGEVKEKIKGKVISRKKGNREIKE